MKIVRQLIPLVIIFLTPILSNCQRGKKAKINLQNGEGVLVVNLPIEMDTTYFWLNQSDSYCTGKYITRMANKQYCLGRESGISQKGLCRDSLYQISIEQDREGCYWLDAEEFNAMVSLDRWKSSELRKIEEFEKLFNPDFIIVEKNYVLMKINERDFMVTKIKSKGEKKTRIRYDYSTLVCNKLLKLTAECQALDCHNFEGDVSVFFEHLMILDK